MTRAALQRWSRAQSAAWHPRLCGLAGRGNAGRRCGNWPAAAEDAHSDALAAMKRVEAAYDAANDRFEAAERALNAAREERATAQRDRYAARQAYERASATADRLARRVREFVRLAGRVNERSTSPGVESRESARRGVASDFPRPRAPYSERERTLTVSRLDSSRCRG